jgi:hypothetical protein
VIALLDVPLNHVANTLFTVLHGTFRLVLLNLFFMYFRCSAKIVACCTSCLLISVMSSPSSIAATISSFKSLILDLQMTTSSFRL